MKANRFERLERFLVNLIQRPGPERTYGLGIRTLLGTLRALSQLYLGIVRLRLFLYAQGIFRHHALGCQVISVGNLTVGGTGKTPVVEIFARELARAGRKVAILSRGYKKSQPPLPRRLMDWVLLRELRCPPRVVSDGRTLLLDSEMSGDEPYMLASNLPDVVVLVDKNRVKSGRYAVRRFGCDTLILDDGFQYMALKHRAEIVLVDRTNPFGNEHVLPRGILREPVSSIRRANFVFITKCQSGVAPEQLARRIRSLNPDAEIIQCQHCARYLRHVFTGERRELEWLRDLQVTAMSGIAAPVGFENELEHRGADILLRKRFADHHRYSQQEIIDIINQSREQGAAAIITTEKDAVRFPKLNRCDVPIYFLRVDIEILTGEEDFHSCIARICFRDAASLRKARSEVPA